MSAPTPASLAMDCELKCDMCNEPVNYGDDYVAHLQFAHQISKNIPFFMEKALKAIKGEKRKIEDVVTLEEEDDISYTGDREMGSNYECSSVIDPAIKANIEKTVERTMDDLFKDIKLMVEGKMPLQVDEENTLDTPYDENADEKI